MNSPSHSRLVLLRLVLRGLDPLTWHRVTSRDLARWVGSTAESVRKDLASLGPSHPGAAYDVAELLERLDAALPIRAEPKTALAGLGELGLGLAANPGSSWTFVAGFDGRPNRLETVEVPFPVFNTTEIVAVCLRVGLEAAVLALPAAEAQKVAERFVQGGVRHLINYSPAVLRVDRNKVDVQEFGGGV